LDVLLKELATLERVLESRVGAVRLRVRIRLVSPGGLVVCRFARVESGEKSVVDLELLGDDVRPVRVDLDVVLVVALVLDRVADDSEEERDVAAGADGSIEVRGGSGSGETRIDGDELCAARLLR